ncbi:TetR/AcrR family transcriptional regulator [Paenibacillus gorillae]|uniref:TetR/AcrR family transcriptional regulator n=1 Tax=Paenibacillus gorillae TaxID=1243662 RepID=UPI0005A9988C|nr:TetR/AcrR family transcriptional regulator [Paenibacillus gorillae]
MTRPREFDAEQVLLQVMEVFWSKGFKSTSFEDLTNKTHVKKQSFYGVFGDKRSLFLETLALYRMQNLQHLQEILSRGQTPADKMDAILHVSLCHDNDENRKGCLMVNTSLEFGVSDDEVTKQVEGMNLDVRHALEEVIEEGQSIGQFTTKYTAAELAMHLSNTLQGIRVAEKSGADKKQIDTILRTSFGLIQL